MRDWTAISAAGSEQASQRELDTSSSTSQPHAAMRHTPLAPSVPPGSKALMLASAAKRDAEGERPAHMLQALAG